uniref:Leucine-rich PPR motif-containing protein, mitochondrial n=1 Tax=Parascaris univalens TaxID=6257 RepID=A0A915AGX8_PARUN
VVVVFHKFKEFAWKAMIGLSRCSRLRLLQSSSMMGSFVGNRIGACQTQMRHLASASTSVQLSNPAKVSADSASVLTMAQRVRRSESQSSLRGRSPFRTRLRMGSRSQQIDREEMQLLEKHRETLDTNELRSIYDVIESIEWRRTVNQTLLDRAIDFLHSPHSDIASLSDRQIGVLFSATGKACAVLSPFHRAIYTTKIANAFRSKGVSLGISARNALLNARIDNSIDVDVIEVLKELKSANIEPNSETFGALSRVYALKGDVVGIAEIVNHMKEIGSATNEEIIGSMIFALALSGREEQALSVIESFSKNGSISEAKLRIAYANAKAKKGEIDSMIKIFDGVSQRLKLQSKQNASLMLDVLFTLLDRGDLSGVEKWQNLLSVDENGKLSEANDFAVIMGRMRQYRDLKHGNISAAICLYKLLPEKYARSQRDFFITYLFEKLRNSGSVSEVIDLGVTFEEAGILKNPRRILIDHALLNNRSKFYELYESFLVSDEYKRIERRAHLTHPYVVHSLNQLSEKMPTEKKGEIFAHITNALFKWETPERRHLREWLLEPLLKNLDALPDLIKKLVKEDRIQSFIASMLIDHLMFRSKFTIVEKTLDGPLKGITLNIASLKGVLKRSLTRPNATEDELKVASRIVATGFPESDERYISPLPAVNVIEEVLLSKAVDEQKARTLIKIWADGGRIALSSEDTDSLQKALKDAGEAAKAKLITVLKKKPQTLLRWKETSDVKMLEDEARNIASSRNPKKHLILQTLYAVISEKRLTEKPLNVESMCWVLECYRTLPDTATHGFFFEFENKLRRTMHEAILIRNVDVAERLWKIGSKKMPTLMKMGYAALLNAVQRIDDAKQILSEIRANADSLDINALANSPLVVGDRKETESFFELVAAIFKLNAESRRRLLSGIRVKEFDTLMSTGHLEEAFAFAKDVSAETGRAYGQLELMRASLENGDMQLLHNVINMVQHKHDKNAALLDFGLALLENERNDHAARVFSTSGLHISSGKLEYFVKRELRLRKPDVLLMLFTNLSEGGRASTVDLNNLLMKLVGFYGSEGNDEGITRLQEAIKKASFPVNEELRKCIESN